MTRNTIGEVAKRAGVGVETIRYYERRGLITQPEKGGSFREYPEDMVGRVEFIRHAKDLGFTLREIGDLLSLRVDPRGNCDAVRTRAQEKIADIEDKLDRLKKMRRSLQRLADACADRLPTAECPILDALD